MVKAPNVSYLLWIHKSPRPKFNKLSKYLPNTASILICSDGSCTKIVDSMNNNTTSTTSSTNHANSYYSDIYSWRKYKINRTYREKWLVNKKKRRSLFACSVHKSGIFEQYRLKTIIPLGKFFIDSEIILHRKMYKLICFSSWWLEKQFCFSGFVWSRQYIFLHKEYSFMILEELFSPFLTRSWFDK